MLDLSLLRRPLRLECLHNRRELGFDLSKRILRLYIHLNLRFRGPGCQILRLLLLQVTGRIATSPVSVKEAANDLLGLNFTDRLRRLLRGADHSINEAEQRR